MKKGLILALALVALAVVAFTARWWAPPLLGVVDDAVARNRIQVLADVTTAVMGAAALGSFVVSRLRRERRQPVMSSSSDIDARGGSVVAQHGGVAAGQIAVGRDNYGNVILIAAPDDLWRAIRKSPPSEDLRQATERYLQYVVDRHRYLDFRGMGVADRLPLRLPLVDMYVPLKARVELPPGGTWERQKRGDQQLRLAGRAISEAEAETLGRLSEPLLVLDLLERTTGLIILGDPGAGKTTFLKYLALRLAQGEGAALGQLGARLPILVSLAAYANALADGDVPLDDFIAAYFRDRGLDIDLGPMLEEAIARGGALLLLDGLDEVKELSRRRLVVDRVVDFFAVQRRRGNKFILTSRIVGYREVRPVVDDLGECTLVDFEDDDIQDFVTRWTAAIESAARGDDSAVAAWEATREREELLAAVQRNPGVRRLAANPLLLTILALMKRQGVTLPERRVELYDLYIKVLLKHWNLARGLDRPMARDLDVVETVRVLAPLALWMQTTSPGIGLVKREDVRRPTRRQPRSSCWTTFTITPGCCSSAGRANTASST